MVQVENRIKGWEQAGVRYQDALRKKNTGTSDGDIGHMPGAPDDNVYIVMDRFQTVRDGRFVSTMIAELIPVMD